MKDEPSLEEVLDLFEKSKSYVQPPLKSQEGQYLLKALDYLVIHSKQTNQPDLVEQPRHEELEGMMTDVIMYAEEEDDGQTQG